MRWGTWLALGLLSNAGGGLCLKRAALDLKEVSLTASSLLAVLSNPFWWGALGCYGFSFGAYFLLLRHFPLSVIYPVLTTGSILFVTLVAILWFGERIDARGSLGMVLMSLGIFCLLGKR